MHLIKLSLGFLFICFFTTETWFSEKCQGEVSEPIEIALLQLGIFP